eukprot:1158103-Pelagomonas_calceolata.AAC.9
MFVTTFVGSSCIEPAYQPPKNSASLPSKPFYQEYQALVTWGELAAEPGDLYISSCDKEEQALHPCSDVWMREPLVYAAGCLRRVGRHSMEQLAWGTLSHACVH